MTDDNSDQDYARTQPYHFTDRQRARLLILRGRVQDGEVHEQPGEFYCCDHCTKMGRRSAI